MSDNSVITDSAPETEFPIPAGVYAEKVMSVQHYTDRLFKFRITRPAALRFRSGEFVMIGLPNAEKPGTLVNDALITGKTLYMISTGTGIAPFASLIREPETYEKFEKVVLTHTCRDVGELAYGYDIVAAAKDDPLVGEEATKQLVHVASTTREQSDRMGRITKQIEDGTLFDDLRLPPLNPETDRGMICGSMDMLKDVKALFEKAGMTEGANNRPAEFVVERAFVD